MARTRPQVSAGTARRLLTLSYMSNLHIELQECSQELRDYVFNGEEVIQRVRVLHREKYRDIRGLPVCRECNVYLPCPTLKTLEG